MPGSLDKIYHHIRSRKLSTESAARSYLKDRIKDARAVDELIARLIKDKVIKPDVPIATPAPEPDQAPEPVAEPKPVPPKPVQASPLADSYRRAMAQYFRLREPSPRRIMKMEMSFKLDWFKPEDADAFIGFCLRDGLIEERAGTIHPTFDPLAIDVPTDWTIHKELSILSGREAALAEMKAKDAARDKKFAGAVARTEERKALADEGIIADAEPVATDGSPGAMATKSPRTKIKSDITKRLVKAGLPSATANHMFDYYELNVGLTDFEGFAIVAAQYEKCGDEPALKKAYDILVGGSVQ